MLFAILILQAEWLVLEVTISANRRQQKIDAREQQCLASFFFFARQAKSMLSRFAASDCCWILSLLETCIRTFRLTIHSHVPIHLLFMLWNCSGKQATFEKLAAKEIDYETGKTDWRLLGESLSPVLPKDMPGPANCDSILMSIFVFHPTSSSFANFH